MEYFQAHLQGIYKLVLGAAGVAQNDPTPSHPSNAQGGAGGAAGIAGSLWNTYGTSVLAAGTKYMQGSAQPGAQQSRAAPPSPSPSAHSTAFDPNGPQFPVPDFPADYSTPPAYIPLPRSNSNLPIGSASRPNSGYRVEE